MNKKIICAIVVVGICLSACGSKIVMKENNREKNQTVGDVGVRTNEGVKEKSVDSLLEHYFEKEDITKLEKLINREEQNLELDGYQFVLKEYIYESTLQTVYALIEIRKPGMDMRKNYNKYKGVYPENSEYFFTDRAIVLIAPYALLNHYGAGYCDFSATKDVLYVYVKLDNHINKQDSFIRFTNTQTYYDVPDGLLSDEIANHRTIDKFDLTGTGCAKRFHYDDITVVLSPFKMCIYTKTGHSLKEAEYTVVYQDGTSEMVLDYDSIQPQLRGGSMPSPWFDQQEDSVILDSLDLHEKMIDVEKIDYIEINHQRKIYPE